MILINTQENLNLKHTWNILQLMNIITLDPATNMPKFLQFSYKKWSKSAWMKMFPTEFEYCFWYEKKIVKKTWLICASRSIAGECTCTSGRCRRAGLLRSSCTSGFLYLSEPKHIPEGRPTLYSCDFVILLSWLFISM